LFSIPVAQDYEPEATRRFADYFVFMETGAPRRDLTEFFEVGFNAMERGFRMRLFDLAAVRYVVAASRVDNTAQVLTPPLHPLKVSGDGQLTVFENQQALPRAFYVPSVEVAPDASPLPYRLAYGLHDLRRIALVEHLPSSGFTAASDARSGGEAEIVVDEPEHVVVRVSTPARGFPHLADQYLPGWRATVNGAPAPILRANYAFRAVEVPAGTSTVEFRYRPVSVLIGAAITAITLPEDAPSPDPSVPRRQLLLLVAVGFDLPRLAAGMGRGLDPGAWRCSTSRARSLARKSVRCTGACRWRSESSRSSVRSGRNTGSRNSCTSWSHSPDSCSVVSVGWSPKETTTQGRTAHTG
jgi:Bacterial membrane protein YfhO